MEETESDGGGERRGEGKLFVLVSTIPDVGRMKGTKAKGDDGAASPGLDGASPMVGLPEGLSRRPQRNVGCPRVLFTTIPARTTPGVTSTVGFPNSAPSLSQP